MSYFRIVGLCALAWLACWPMSAAHARAHCFCKLGPIGAPYHDFGEIDSYSTQIGHDSACHNTCSSTVSSYLSNAANKTAMCAAANGGSLIASSAVGTRPYTTASTTTCPAGPGGPAGFISFAPWITARTITVNGTGVNPYAPPPSVPISGNNTSFTIFEFTDTLHFHVQQWTYDLRLYRDGALVEQLSKKSPPASGVGVSARFTGQSNAFVHGHTWKIEWHYAGPNFQNGSATFYIP